MGRSRNGSSSAGNQASGARPECRSWSGLRFCADRESRNWDEFGGIALSVQNTVVASYRQMCVQKRPSTRDHSDLIWGEFRLPSRNASTRGSTGQNSLAVAYDSVKRNDRAKLHVGVGTIEEWLNCDIRVSKPLCSRCALNVSFWGILWRSLSRFDDRKLLIGKVSL